MSVLPLDVPNARRSLKILICGGGCAGPALAYWLANSGHRVTLMERFPALRAFGAQVDLRSQGIEAVRRMGLLDAVRSRLVDEPGVAFVDSHGNAKATIMANTSGQGAQSLTSEYEIMRGDLVRILYEATKDRVEYVFGQSVERFDQEANEVVAHFSDGSSRAFDLLVGADGQGSRIRAAILRSDEKDPYKHMGLYMAYWFIPRAVTDDNIRKTYLGARGRMIMRRSHNASETQVYFVLRDRSEVASGISQASLDRQKHFWTEKFIGAGWQTDRFLEGMKNAENFYCQEVVQVRIASWSKGRVALLGDAAYCASPFSGMGTTGALVGAYVLAGEINRNPQNPTVAFANYEAILRPFIDEIQKVSPLLLRLGIPETQWGAHVLRSIAGVLCALRIPDLIAKLASRDKGGWKLPDYQELGAQP